MWYPKGIKKAFVISRGTITELLNQSIGTSLSDIKDTINLTQGENVITSKEVKLLLVKFLSDKIQFLKQCQTNQSLIFFSSNLSVEHVIRKRQSINIIKSAATEIRNPEMNLLLNLKTNFVMQKNLETPGITLTCYMN